VHAGPFKCRATKGEETGNDHPYSDNHGGPKQPFLPRLVVGKFVVKATIRTTANQLRRNWRHK
jgi:hypothetical protein